VLYDLCQASKGGRPSRVRKNQVNIFLSYQQILLISCLKSGERGNLNPQADIPCQRERKCSTWTTSCPQQRYPVLLCSALFGSALLYSAWSALVCSILLCSAPLYSTLLHSILLCSVLLRYSLCTLLYYTPLNSALLHSALVYSYYTPLSLYGFTLTLRHSTLCTLLYIPLCGIGSHCRAIEWTNWRRCGKFATEQNQNVGWNVTHTKIG
jgi:hypothetical protein